MVVVAAWLSIVAAIAFVVVAWPTAGFMALALAPLAGSLAVVLFAIVLATLRARYERNEKAKLR